MQDAKVGKTISLTTGARSTQAREEADFHGTGELLREISEEDACRRGCGEGEDGSDRFRPTERKTELELNVFTSRNESPDNIVYLLDAFQPLEGRHELYMIFAVISLYRAGLLPDPTPIASLERLAHLFPIRRDFPRDLT